MFLIPDPDEEIREIERHRNRRAAAQAPDASLADRLTRLAQTHTHVAGGALLSLAKAGVEPDQPVAQEAARRATIQKVRNPLSFYRPGQVVTGGDIANRKAMAERAERARAEEDQRQAQIAASRGEAQAAIHGDDPVSKQDRVREIIGEGRARGVDVGAMGAASPDIDLNDAARGTFMALAAPLQEGVGAARAIATDPLSPDFQTQSDLGIWAENKLAGEGPTDTGEGVFVDPESGVAQERLRREREYDLIGGHVWTPGRWLANSVAEPGSKPFNLISGLVDAGIALKLDPSAAALSKAGAVKGVRNTLQSPAAARHWLDGRDGLTIKQWLADTDDFHTIWKATGKKLPVDLTVKLADTKSTSEVDDLLSDVLGTLVREKPQVTGNISSVVPLAGTARAIPAAAERASRGFDIAFGGSKGYVRLAQTMPAGRIDLQDADDAVEQLDRFLRNAKIPEPDIATFTNRMARSTGQRHQQYAVITDAMDAVTARAVGAGVNTKEARKLGTMFLEQHDELRRYFVNQIGENVDFPGAMVDGAGGIKASPHLFVEVLDRFVPLPNARDIRQAISPFRSVLRNPAVRLPHAAADFLINRIWKDSVLLRIAYPIRVIGEEQFRMAAAGMDSTFRHPISYISYLVGRKGGEDILGNAWDDVEDYRRALTKGSAGFRDPAGVHRTRHRVRFDRDADEFVPSWGDELAQLHADPIVKQILDTNDLQSVKEWFWNGRGGFLRHDLIASWENGSELATRANADRYIETLVDRLQIKTGGDSRLIEAVRTGRLNGNLISDDGAKLNKGFVDELRGIADEGVGPDRVKGELRVITGVKDAKGALAESYERATEFMFGYLMGKPTNLLSRSKSFEQFYWKRMGELVPFMDDATQAAAIARAKTLGIKLKRAGEAGDLDMAGADLLAKGWALDSTKNLLYDLSERGQFFDVFRLIFPFGEAWKEMVTRWPKLLVENPKIARRLQQGIEGARDAGFFYEDPVSGDEVFTYPGSAWMNERLIGVPIPLTGRVQGLSLMTEVLPGVGPVVQIPAGYLIPDTPDWDWLRDKIIPFGDMENPTDAKSWLPPWAQKLGTVLAPTGEQQRQFSITTMQMATYLRSTGEYDINGPDGESEIDRLLGDAKEKAKWLFVIRGIAQVAAPSAPSPQEIVEDPSGQIHLLGVLKDEYRQLYEDDPDQATQRFLDKWGDDLDLVMQSASYSVIFGAPVSKEGMNWERKNKGIAKKYPATYGYFAPQGGEFDLEAYQRQFETGKRETITPEQAVALSNQRIGSLLFRNAQEKVGPNPTDEQRTWLNQIREGLKQEYPGYERPQMLPQRPETDQLIDELKRAVKDPLLRETEQGEALDLYLLARTKAEDAAAAAGLQRSSFAGAKAMRGTRDWLRAVGAELVNEYPQFSEMWEGILSRELADDLEEAAA